ncbi:MAG: asparagine synthase-related protein [Candidatus Micrarchaeota archaeon]
MDKLLARKLSSLRERIRKLDSALVAFSGGVDSAFLMRICREELGEKAVAVTALSDNYPKSELSMARRVAKILGVKHMVVQRVEDETLRAPLLVKGSSLYSRLKGMAMRLKLKNVLDGSHRDDLREKGDSFLSARRAGVRSPLLESDLSKAEIRLLAREFNLPNWDRASSAEYRLKKAKALPSLANLRAAREYLKGEAPTATVGFRGARVIIGVSGAKAAVWLASRLKVLQNRMRKLGYSEIILKVCDWSAPAKGKKKGAPSCKRLLL